MGGQIYHSPAQIALHGFAGEPGELAVADESGGHGVILPQGARGTQRETPRCQEVVLSIPATNQIQRVLAKLSKFRLFDIKRSGMVERGCSIVQSLQFH